MAGDQPALQAYVLDGEAYAPYRGPVTLTQLRKNLYTVFDCVAAGEGPVRIDRNGTVIVIEREESTSRLARLQDPATNACIGDSDEVIGMSWENEWNRLPT